MHPNKNERKHCCLFAHLATRLEVVQHVTQGGLIKESISVKVIN